MKYLVTGIDGQDGRIAGRLLLNRGHQVFGIGRKVKSNLNVPNIQYFSSQTSDLYQILIGIAPDFILHLAGVHQSEEISNSSESEISHMHFTHVQMTEMICEWLSSAGGAHRAVFALSSHMYKPVQFPSLISENSDLGPKNHYGSTKLEALEIIRNYRNYGCKGLTSAILFNHTSVHSKETFIFPKLAKQIQQVITGKSKQIDVKNINSRIDISDAEEVVSGILSLVDSQLEVDIIFGSGKAEKISSIARATLELFGVSADKVELGYLGQEGEGYFSDPKAARDQLGWHAKSPQQILFEQVTSLL